MYGYEYETDVLFMLRLAKYLYGQDPDALKKVLEIYPEFDLCLLFELSECIIWEICGDVVFDSEDEFEITFCTFAHPIINRFCELSAARNSGRPTVAWQRKLADIVEYFLRGIHYSVVKIACYSGEGSAKLRAWFSQDCYDSGDFGSSLVDMLLFFQRENERLEWLLKEANTRKEAA